MGADLGGAVHFDRRCSGLNLLGDGLRDLTDPKLREEDDVMSAPSRTRHRCWKCAICARVSAWRASTCVAVRSVDLEVARREVLGIIGEFGSGKSVTGLSMLRLLPAHATVTEPTGFDLPAANCCRSTTRHSAQLRGTHLAMVFQDPVGAFNPAKSIGWHLDRIIARAATREDRQGIDLTQDAHRWLTDVGIAHPERILPLYPHQLSGGMLQRTLIALTAALQPDLLIADEPTTNLDNIVERQIIGLFRRLKDKLGSAIIFITHDIALAAGSVRPHRRDVRGRDRRDRTGRRAVQVAGASLHGGSDRDIPATRRTGRAAEGDSRRTAVRAAVARRLPVRAALRICNRCVPSCAASEHRFGEES